MAEFLLELFSEEIPARMQAQAEEDLRHTFETVCQSEKVEALLENATLEVYSTPRRLVLHVTGLDTSIAGTSQERRGPRVDAPKKAIDGFKRSLPEGCEIEEREEKKGTFLYAKIITNEQDTAFVLRRIGMEVVHRFPWPKSMAWGENTLRWVRPLSSVVAVLDAKIVKGHALGVSSDLSQIDLLPFSDTTQGHRFMAPGEIRVTDFGDYRKKLEQAYVLIDRAERRARIEKGAEALARKASLDLVPDEKLLDEVTGLVEWPVPLIGAFDEDFLDLPPEVLVSEMRHHQKYFALRDPESGRLANRFIVVANIETADKGRAIVAGNGRVLAARLSDARFFWDQDRKSRLEDALPRLEDIVFHEKLGTVGERTRRMAALARELAKFIPGCDAGAAERAAALAKADLVSGMVGEFPDLQGIMGGYYAKAQGEGEDVASAIAEHYAPQGPGDVCPAAPVSVAVALAEKLDVLVGFFGIDQRPTGSKDPYALRRAALGLIRLITENELRLPLQTAVMIAENGYAEQTLAAGDKSRAFTLKADQLWHELIAFIADRLKVQTRERGVRHDLIDAVFSVRDAAGLEEEDLVRLLARVDALQSFLATEDGENLLAGYRRASNIVGIEERKDGKPYDGEVDATLLVRDEEKALFKALLTGQKAVDKAVAAEKFKEAMAAIAALRAPVDAFFDHVTVNCEDKNLRVNRLRLLSQIRASLGTVADFSRIEG